MGVHHSARLAEHGGGVAIELLQPAAVVPSHTTADGNQPTRIERVFPRIRASVLHTPIPHCFPSRIGCGGSAVSDSGERHIAAAVPQIGAIPSLQHGGESGADSGCGHILLCAHRLALDAATLLVLDDKYIGERI